MTALPRVRAMLAAAAVVAGLGACGGDAERAATAGPTTGAEPSPPAAAGTPRQAVLGWWRYVQANDPESARALYLVPPPLPDLAGQFNFLGEELDGELKVLAIDAEGMSARVRVRWSPADAEPRRVTLRLREEEEGGWKLVRASFLDQMVAEREREEG